QGARSAFALCRPPGHHAASDLMGGYCYLNNAAIAAQAFLDQGHTKVAILDVDYHHGNGTQSIFDERDGVLFTSLHGHPAAEVAFFRGYADAVGEGAVVSLGVDTFKDDPISQFKLDSPDYLAMGARIARLGKPTLFVMEGGYAVEEIGINAVNVLEGFEGFAQ
ncbi:MAG: histone deacetylase family protein, partial [Sulfitobacter sp.]|nr:histone deacetylase family protein [Sulfitobacter sp.]